MWRTVIIVLAGLLWLAGLFALVSGNRERPSPAGTSGGQGIGESPSRIGRSALSHGGPAQDKPAPRKTEQEEPPMPDRPGYTAEPESGRR